MVKMVVVKKRHIIIYTALVFLLAFMVVIIQNYIRDNNKTEYITYAQAAKMIAYAAVGDEVSFSEDKEWYKPYMDYVNINEYMYASDANGYVKYKDLYIVARKLGAEDKCLVSIGIGDIYDIKNDNRLIKKETFIKGYKELLKYFEYGENVESRQLGIVGVSLGLENEEWKVYTTEGTFKYDGVIIEPYVDKTIEVLVRNDKLLCVSGEVSDSVTYENVLIKDYEKGNININVYGVIKKYKMSKKDNITDNTLADIYIEKGKITNIDIKTDIITGKVLSIASDYIEIEGYGKVSLDNKFIIYDSNAENSVSDYTSIIVGYALQDFIVAKGKICGAVKGQELVRKNIRVMLKTTGYKELFHQTVSLVSDSVMHIEQEDNKWDIPAGQVYTIDRNDENLKKGRIKVYTDNGYISVNSINRSQGVPKYKGSMELALYDEGIALINELDIEDYLKKVVPSEMPVSYGVNALRCQAVCARSYAYTQLTNNYYNQYGAHVDDSVSFQVYNNTDGGEAADEAVESTRGKVIFYGEDIVKTYYYSTSCGFSADVCAWGSDDNSYPMYKSVRVSSSQEQLNIQDNAVFEKYITSQNENDYDYGCSLYRWNTRMELSALTSQINSKLANAAAKSNVYVYNENNELVVGNVKNVGEVRSIEVIKRGCGGVISELKITGSDAVCVVKGENTIRTLIGSSKADINTGAGVAHYDILPSAFCMFKPVYENATLVAYEIIGGGYGHGIGMSQNAVKKMSEFMDYTDILKFFYKDIEIKNAS